MRRWRSCLLTLFFRLKRKLFGKQYAAQSALERTNGALAWGSRKFGADYETLASWPVLVGSTGIFIRSRRRLPLSHSRLRVWICCFLFVSRFTVHLIGGYAGYLQALTV